MERKKLLFATGNINKVRELRSRLENLPFDVLTMREAGFKEDIPETGSTLLENSILKAQYLYSKTGENVLAEDTGLEVDALNGAPGVHTARYAGEKRDPDQNMNLLLKNLEAKNNRSARFHTVITLIISGKQFTFNGYSEGAIGLKKSGQKGFGYDPIFIPKNYRETFAEMSMDEKSKISHRSRAFDKMELFLMENKNLV